MLTEILLTTIVAVVAARPQNLVGGIGASHSFLSRPSVGIPGFSAPGGIGASHSFLSRPSVGIPGFSAPGGIGASHSFLSRPSVGIPPGGFGAGKSRPPLGPRPGIGRPPAGSAPGGFGAAQSRPPPGSAPGGISSFQGPAGPVVPILVDERQGPNADGSYSFNFETGDGIRRQEQGTPQGPAGAVVQQGSWSFTFPDGTPAVFNFIADENGYRVESDLLPTPPPLPPHAIAQIEKAQQEDAAAAASGNTGSYNTSPAQTLPSPIHRPGFGRPSQSNNYGRRR